MEDPWAAGPSWSTPAKSPREIDQGRHATPPPEEFDADPWGTGATKVEPRPTWGDDQPKWGFQEASALPELTGAEEEPSSPDAQISPSKQESVTTSGSKELVLNSPPLSPAVVPDDQPRTTIEDEHVLSETMAVSQDDSTAPVPSQSNPILQSTPDEPDPEAQFLSALKISSPKPSSPSPQSPAKSPVFSDGGFGGFSSHMDSSDPWGGGTYIPVASGSRMPAWGGSEEDDAAFSPTLGHGADDDEAVGWEGGSGKHHFEARGTAQDEDWEEAQRVMRLRADRVPDEKVQKLKAEWIGVAEAAVGQRSLERLSDEDESKLEQGVSSMQSEMRETLRSLSSIPSDISTYPPVISSSTTHERHIYALSRPNSVPSTSLLNVSLARRSRRVDTLLSSSPWLSRSRLGEPDVAQPEATAPSMSPEDPKARWSFWGKKATAKPLITSGGSILEVKTPPPDQAARASGSGEMARSSSRAPSISVSSKSSRPASPAPPPMSSPQQPSVHSGMPNSVSMESVGHTAPSGALATQTPGGPSAVSRFFGRLSRKHSSQPSTDLDGTDLQLSTDDFNFLQEVPSLAESSSMDHGPGDLLSLESGRPEQIAGLESMLTSKPAAIPPPLAPPPSTAIGRVASGGAGPSSRFVARMKPPAATDMDLLGGLDFDSDASASPTTSLRDGPSGTTSMWDDFLDSGPPKAVQQSSHMLQKSTTLPQQPSTSVSLDDFGDFADFTTAAESKSQPNLATPARTARNHSNLVLDPQPSISHARAPSVDHSSTMNLMSEATAVKGRRWPAPPSPAAPNLDPPPRPQNQRQASGGFPFLSPPPPPRPASGLGRSHDLLDDGETTPTGIGLTPPPAVVPLRQNTLSPPIPSTAPQAGLAKNQPRLSAGTNLTASDLSFFDSL